MNHAVIRYANGTVVRIGGLDECHVKPLHQRVLAQRAILNAQWGEFGCGNAPGPPCFSVTGPGGSAILR